MKLLAFLWGDFGHHFADLDISGGQLLVWLRGNASTTDNGRGLLERLSKTVDLGIKIVALGRELA